MAISERRGWLGQGPWYNSKGHQNLDCGFRSHVEARSNQAMGGRHYQETLEFSLQLHRRASYQRRQNMRSIFRQAVHIPGKGKPFRNVSHVICAGESNTESSTSYSLPVHSQITYHNGYSMPQIILKFMTNLTNWRDFAIVWRKDQRSTTCLKKWTIMRPCCFLTFCKRKKKRFPWCELILFRRKSGNSCR